MDRGRANNGFGPLPLSFSELDAWCRLNAERLSPDEASIIRAMDDAYLSAWSERNGEASGKKPKVSAQPMTRELFDALF